MLAQHFVSWCETATVSERCAAVAMLADAVVGRKFLPGDIRQAEAALMLAVEDPSPRVRRVVAEGVARADNVPHQLVRILAEDVDDVALVVAAFSPLLTEADLRDLALKGRSSVRSALARRPDLSAAVALDIAGSGDEAACAELARNHSAPIGEPTLRRLAEAFRDSGHIRHLLLERDDLPSALRHDLVTRLGRELCDSPFVANLVGSQRVVQLHRDLQERATACVIEQVKDDEVRTFVEHLRGASQLNAAVLVRAVCMGRIDLFAASMSRLTGLPEDRVRAVIADAREPAFNALASAAGLPRSVVPLLLSGVRIWKDMAGEDRLDQTDVASTVMDRVVVAFRRRGHGEGTEELTHLLHHLSSEVQKQTAKRRAGRYLAA